MKAVVDTNVLVSGLISPGGPPGTIVNMIVGGSLQICYDARIFAEYGAVLVRPEFDIASSAIRELLDQIVASGETIPGLPLISSLPDRSDEAFLEVALAAQADCLITGNLKHFPTSSRQGIRVFSPVEFFEFYRSQQDRAGGMVKSPSAEYRTPKRKKSFRSSRCNHEQREISLAEFFRRVDETRDAGDRQWTAEEVAHVIHRIRRSAPSRRIKRSIRKTVRDLTKKRGSRTTLLNPK